MVEDFYASLSMSIDTHSVKFKQLDYLLTHAHRSSGTEIPVSHGSKDSTGSEVRMWRNNAISSATHNGNGSGKTTGFLRIEVVQLDTYCQTRIDDNVACTESELG